MNLDDGNAQMMKEKLSPDYVNWLADFENDKGRPLRVLHLGNIANNAFYIAKFLNQVGVHADVLAYENYHMMSSPEWEDAEFLDVPSDQYFPNWWDIVPDYEHPVWFAQGPWGLCVQYLQSRLRGDERLVQTYRQLLTKARQRAYSYRWLYRFARRYGRLIPEPYFSYLKTKTQRLVEKSVELMTVALQRSQPKSRQQPDGDVASFSQQTIDRIVEEFVGCFPDRPDSLSASDINLFYKKAELLQSLFREYDIVHAYGTDAIYPLLARYRPYVAFEHGTLRDVHNVTWTYKGPFFPNAVGRLTALAYSKADHVFVTNADTLPNVLRLGIQRYTPVGHPFDENCRRGDTSNSDEIRSQVDADFLLLCPIRHDWLEKGTHKYIYALPLLRRALGNRFKVCFMPWGKEVERSKRLISKLRCDDLVKWVGPFGQYMFNRWLVAADVVFDQLSFSSFSGTTPRALACGVPVIVKYDHQVMKWMFPDPPPVLAAESEDDIVSQTMRALNPEFRREYKTQARQWIKTYHSVEVLLNKLVSVYKEVLSVHS